MFVTNWISPTKIQKISEITNFFRHYFLSRTEVYIIFKVVDKTVGVRVDKRVEEEGLDIYEHGESAYSN